MTAPFDPAAAAREAEPNCQHDGTRLHRRVCLECLTALATRAYAAGKQARIEEMDMVKDGVCLACGNDTLAPIEREVVALQNERADLRARLAACEGERDGANAVCREEALLRRRAIDTERRALDQLDAVQRNLDEALRGIAGQIVLTEQRTAERNAARLAQAQAERELENAVRNGMRQAEALLSSQKRTDQAERELEQAIELTRQAQAERNEERTLRVQLANDSQRHLDEMIQQRTRADQAEARAAGLRKYAAHLDGCPQLYAPSTESVSLALAYGPCTCGLDAALGSAGHE